MFKDIPILQFDNSPIIINPQEIFPKIDIPKHAVLCFFYDVINSLVENNKAKLITSFKSEAGLNHVYEVDYLGEKVAVVHPGLGAPYAAIILEALIASGVEKVIACGSAGVLNKNILVGQLIIPNYAIRDEGTSYHYLPCGKEVEIDPQVVHAIAETLDKHNCKYMVAKTWTTDASFRETVKKVELRKEEGCVVVEMECSALSSVAKNKNIMFGHILYAGDNVDIEGWDFRDFINQKSIREKLFWLTVESVLNL